MRTTRVSLIGTVFLLALAAPVLALAGGTRVAHLAPTGVIPGAEGIALASVQAHGSEHLKVMAEGLVAGEIYTVLLDGVPLADLEANEDGEIKGKWGAPAGRSEMELPESFLPLAGIESCAIADAAGAVVLEGAFRGPGGGPGGVPPVRPHRPDAFRFAVLHLDRTDAAPEDAGGVAVTRWFLLADSEVREDLKVSVCGFAPGEELEVVVDDVPVGSMTADDEGHASLFLSTREASGADPLPAEIRPVTEIGHVEVRDAADVAVLVGDMEDARTHGSDHPLPSYVAVAAMRDAGGLYVGVAVARMVRDVQQFDLAVAGLEPGAEYTLVVDGVDAGTYAADPAGVLWLRMSEQPGRGEIQIPEALLPVMGLAVVELRDASDAVVASGEFAVVIDSGSGSVRRGVGRMRAADAGKG